MRTLVLNQDFTFLGVCDWKDSISAVYCGKAIIEEEFENEVHSVSITMKIPAVIRLKRYVKILYERISYVSYNKRNVHLRDNFICQYCSEKKIQSKLGIDHILPESRGGLSNWINTVSCCSNCNTLKGNRTPQEAGMKLIRIPSKPKSFREIVRIKLGELHDLWKPYL